MKKHVPLSTSLDPPPSLQQQQQQQPQPPPHSASAASALSALALEDNDDVAGGDYRSNGEQQQQQQRPASASGAAAAAAAASAPPGAAAAAAAASSATGSAQGLDLTGAAISSSAPAVGDLSSSVDRSEREAPAIVLPHQRGERVGHIALDIGGSLIKLVYFSPSADASGDGSSVEGGGQGQVGGQQGGAQQQKQGERPRSASASERAAAAAAAAAPAGAAPAGAASAGAGSPAAGEKATAQLKSSPSRPRPPRGGKLHFVKFETSKIDECLDFIEAKGLHRPQQGMGGFYGSFSSSGLADRRSGSVGGAGVGGGGGGGGGNGNNKNNDPPTRVRVLATGGGAYRFADLFRSRLGVILEKEDEMDCLVAGADFLLRAVRHEAFTFLDGTVRYHRPGRSSSAAPSSSSSEQQQQQPGPSSSSGGASSDDPYPYLLVNIGSGVSMVRVDGPGDSEHARVSGSSLGGGTFWGLCRLLTGARSFDEMLELSSRGDNTKVDMLVGDIYGKDRDYSAIGLAASTIASSFGKAAAADLDLECYDRADVAMALCRMVSYNIGHLAYLNAKRYGLSRVFFGKTRTRVFFFLFEFFFFFFLLLLFFIFRKKLTAFFFSTKNLYSPTNKKKKNRRLLHPRSPLHDGDDQLRHPLLVPRGDGGELPQARGVPRGRRGLPEGAPAALARRRRRRGRRRRRRSPLLFFDLCSRCCGSRRPGEGQEAPLCGRRRRAASADASDVFSDRRREAKVCASPALARGPGAQKRRGGHAVRRGGARRGGGRRRRRRRPRKEGTRKRGRFRRESGGGSGGGSGSPSSSARADFDDGGSGSPPLLRLRRLPPSSSLLL